MGSRPTAKSLGQEVREESVQTVVAMLIVMWNTVLDMAVAGLVAIAAILIVMWSMALDMVTIQGTAMVLDDVVIPSVILIMVLGMVMGNATVVVTIEKKHSSIVWGRSGIVEPRR